MSPAEFIKKNVAMLLTKNFPMAKKIDVETCAENAKKHFEKSGNFRKGKTFDTCYDLAVKELKPKLKVR